VTSPRVVAIIQGRMGSSRLPGKTLMPLGPRSVLGNVITRVQAARLVDDVVVATTDEPVDDLIEAEARRFGADVFRGSGEDVLDRYMGAATAARADVVVRVTADCPLLDPGELDDLIGMFLRPPGNSDYVTNTLERSFPRGLDVEVFSAEALKRASANARAQDEREHVTLHFRRHPDIFRLRGKTASKDLSHHRWTLDTPEDLTFLRKVFELGEIDGQAIPPFQRVVEMLDAHPEIVAINAGVRQKPIADEHA
jgi:spore coat polysaccharide biosynthesis protein SpsF